MLSISSAIFFVFLQITGKSYQQYGGKIFISVLISLISLFFVTWRYIYIRNDKPDSAESGSITLTAIMKLKSAKEKDGKTYFSIWEYKRLR
jgi:uncharacterized membrane protein YoaK (UPF0700 family)